MIPFLKNRYEASAMGDEDEGSKRPDSDEYGMLDALADDMMEAIHQKDKGLMRDALQALCDYLRDEDEEQDEELEK